MPSSFESKYPAITRWAKEFGVIEIGHDGFVDNFVKALDKGGMPWGGKSTYRTIDEALEEMERGIKAFLKEQGLDKEPRSAQRTSGRVSKPARGSTRRSAQAGQKAPVESQEKRDRSKDQPFVKKVRKLGEIAEALRRGEDFPITRLTILKGLCEDPKAAEAFAQFLIRQVRKKMQEKESAERYRALVNRAVRELGPCLEHPTEDRRERLRVTRARDGGRAERVSEHKLGFGSDHPEHGAARGRDVSAINPSDRRSAALALPGCQELRRAIRSSVWHRADTRVGPDGRRHRQVLEEVLRDRTMRSLGLIRLFIFRLDLSRRSALGKSVVFVRVRSRPALPCSHPAALPT